MTDHIDNTDNSELEAMQNAYSSQKKGSSLNNEPVVEKQVATPPVTQPLASASPEPPAAPAPTPEPPAAPSSIKEPILDTPKTNEPAVSPIPEKTKTIEEIIAERTGGKYKSFDEIEKIINAPKEEFANDDIRHWNDLAKKGYKFDKEFFELQNLDLDKEDHDPEEILMESMKRKPEFQGLSDRALKRKIDKTYNLTEWIEKAESDLTEDDLDNKELLMRDALNNLNWLRDYKKERTFIKDADPAVLQQQAETQRVFLENWNTFVDNDLVSKTNSFKIVIDPEKQESFEYKISEADRKEIGSVMKSLVRKDYDFFERYNVQSPDGKVVRDHQKLFMDLVKAKAFDEAVKHSYSDGKAIGARDEFSKLKNVTNTPADNSIQTGVPKTEAEAVALAMKKQGVKF